MFKTLREADSDYPFVSNFGLLAFCGYVIIWYLQIGYRIPVLGDIRFEFIYAASLSAYIIFSGIKIKMDCPVVKAILLLFLAMIIEIPFSYNVQYSWDVFVDRVIKFSFMAFFIVSFVKGPKQLLFFTGAFLLACLKMGQEGFTGQITGSLVWENQGVMRLHGATPNYQHPNSFSGMALGTIPFILYLFPISKKNIKILLAIELIFSTTVVLCTGSRTGYVAFIVMIIFVIMRSKKRLKTLSAILIIGLVSIQFIPNEYKQRFMTLYTGKDMEGHSIDMRKQIIEDAIQIFIEHPFGVGVSAFPTIRMKQFGRSQDTHNLYLEVATNLGIQGLIIFSFFIFRLLKTLSSIYNSIGKQILQITGKLSTELNSMNASRYTKHLNDLRLIEALIKSVLMFIIIRLALGLFGMDLYEIYWWFAGGIAISIFNMDKFCREKTKTLLEM